MELEMAEATSTRVSFCGSPHAGMFPILVGPITQHQFVKSFLSPRKLGTDHRNVTESYKLAH